MKNANKNKRENNKLTKTVVIVGGGIANVFDRITRGEVTDFFFIDLGGVFKTGIFNSWNWLNRDVSSFVISG